MVAFLTPRESAVLMSVGQIYRLVDVEYRCHFWCNFTSCWKYSEISSSWNPSKAALTADRYVLSMLKGANEFKRVSFHYLLLEMPSFLQITLLHSANQWARMQWQVFEEAYVISLNQTLRTTRLPTCNPWKQFQKPECFDLFFFFKILVGVVIRYFALKVHITSFDPASPVRSSVHPSLQSFIVLAVVGIAGAEQRTNPMCPRSSLCLSWRLQKCLGESLGWRLLHVMGRNGHFPF